MTNSYCQNCGAELDAGAKFCSECGERVSGVDENQMDQGGRRTFRADATGDTTFAALTHLLALFTWVIGPLVVLVATEDSFVEENARNALNWQIILTIYTIISFILVLVFIGAVFLTVLGFLDVAFCVLAAVKANDGEAWKYPLTPELV